MNAKIQKLFLVILTAAAIVSCAKKEFVINGEVKNAGAFDGTKVLLSERINREWKDLDSAAITNGKFTLKGSSDSAKIAYLRFKTNADEKFNESFILENGVLTVNVDSDFNILVNGTEQNNIIAELNKQSIEYNKKTVEISKKYIRNDQITPSAKDSINSEIKKLMETAPLKPFDLMIKNVNTPAGTLIFFNNFYEMSVAEKEQLFAKMDEKTKSNQRIAELIAATEVEKKTSEGSAYVDFTMNDQNGKPVKLSDLVEKTDYLLIDFWASWCPPCRESLPALTEFYAKNKGKKFDIIGVSFDMKKENWTDAIKSFKLPWTNVSDLKYWDNEAGKLYAVKSIPATVLIDKNGKIAGRNLELSEIQNLLNQITTK